MSKKNKSKKDKPQPHQEGASDLYYETVGDTVSVATAFMQAANLLDLAAISAVQYGDTVAMAAVAHQWMEMALLMQGRKPEDEPEESFTETKVIGFGTKEMREAAEDAARNRVNSERIPR